MRLSASGRAKLLEFEGVREHAYRDSAGYWTIGVGHLLTKDELTSGKVDIAGDLVKWRNGLTHEQVDLLFEMDVRQYERAVNECVRVKLEQHQFDALVSMAFNIGGKAFCNSTLVRWINDGRLQEAPEQMRRWVYAGGEIHGGLVKRREAEVEMWRGEHEAVKA